MNELGYTAKCWDIFDDPTDLLEEGPYDVVIAGEFIEHLVDLGVLLRFAKRVLAPKGLLIVTTPNPFAPWRVRAGQVGLVTENADHICLINPSGFAELCDREGVTLQAAWSAEHKAASPPSVKASLWQFLRSTRLEAFLRRRAPSGLNGNWLSPFEVVLARHRASHGWTGETGIYIVSMTPPSSPVDADLDAFDKLTGGFKRS